jgi:predicted acetyltransferase
MPVRYRVMRRSDVTSISDVLGEAFGTRVEEVPGWLERAGFEHVRVLENGKRVAAALLTIPMGQFFGGRSVPMVGIAGVGTDAIHRGRGLATELLTETLRELADGSVALSTLYPATEGLYRRMGYEIAGTRASIRVPMRELKGRDRDLGLRPFTDRDRKAVQAVYRAFASSRSGWLDRGPYVWSRIEKGRSGPPRALVLEDGHKVKGYVFYHGRGETPGRRDVAVLDFAALEEPGWRRLFSFLADQRTMTNDVTWHGSFADRWLHAVGELRYADVRVDHYWMLRIVHVEQALAARGYPAGIHASVHFAIEDDVVTRNTGRFVLEVRNGRGKVRRGGKGTFALDIRALSSLYAGFETPAALEARGALSDGGTSSPTVAALFAGAPPSMTDFF